MFKFIILSYFIYLFSIKRTNNLYCGLFGYSGSTPPDMTAVKILGMYNIARGTDSCGILIDNELHKGVGIESNWIKFIEKNKLPDPKEDYTIIGHTRKSTMGAHSKNNAHPFAFYQNDKQADTFFFGAHNGVISNTDDLCKTYNLLESDYDVDSQVLLAIISEMKTNKKNVEVFKEYKGAAALLFKWVDEPNTLYAFHGKSLTYKTSAVAVEERPLYYYKVRGKDQVYLSSIKESLMAIGGNDESVKEVEHNKIYRFNAGKVQILKQNVDRSNIVTNDDVFTQGNHYNQPSYQRESASSSNTSIGTSITKTIEENVLFQKACIEATFNGFPKADLDKIGTLKHGDFTTLNFSDKRFSNNSLSVTLKSVVIDKEPLNVNNLKGKLTFWRGRYYKNGHILGRTGVEECIADLNGYPKSHKNFRENNSPRTYYFFYGNMLKDKESADKIKELHSVGKFKENYGSAVENEEKLVLNRDALNTYKDLFDNLINQKNYDTGGSFKSNSKFISSGSWLAELTYIPHFYRGVTYTFKNGWFQTAKFDPNYVEVIKSKTEIVVEEVETEEVDETTGATMSGDELSALLDECYKTKRQVTAMKEKLELINSNDLVESTLLSKFYRIFKQADTFIKGMLYDRDFEEEENEEEIAQHKVF